MIVERKEKLFVRNHFFAPGFAVECLELIEFFLWKRFEALPFEVFIARHPADGRFSAQGPAARAVYDPFQHAHVLTEAGPHKLSVGVLAEPVYMEDARSFAQIALHLNPMTEVIAHVIAAKRQHGHGIAADIAGCAGRSRRRLRAHRGADVYARAPIRSEEHT